MANQGIETCQQATEARHQKLVNAATGALRTVANLHQPADIICTADAVQMMGLGRPGDDLHETCYIVCGACDAERFEWPCDTYLAIEEYVHGINTLTDIYGGDREAAETAWALGERPTEQGAEK